MKNKKKLTKKEQELIKDFMEYQETPEHKKLVEETQAQIDDIAGIGFVKFFGEGAGKCIEPACKPVKTNSTTRP